MHSNLQNKATMHSLVSGGIATGYIGGHPLLTLGAPIYEGVFPFKETSDSYNKRLEQTRSAYDRHGQRKQPFCRAFQKIFDKQFNISLMGDTLYRVNLSRLYNTAPQNNPHCRLLKNFASHSSLSRRKTILHDCACSLLGKEMIKLLIKINS